MGCQQISVGTQVLIYTLKFLNSLIVCLFLIRKLIKHALNILDKRIMIFIVFIELPYNIGY